MDNNKKSWVWAGAVFLVVIIIIVFIFVFTNNSLKNINEKSPCILNNYSCYDSCPSNYAEVDIGCGMGVCCKKTDQKQYLLYGYVDLKEGNCMPPIDPSRCTTKRIITQIAVFPKTNIDQVVNNYYRPVIGPIKMAVSNADDIEGYYKINLEPGAYSIFAKDSKENNDFYCNSFDDKGCACCVILDKEQGFDILIDHSVQ
jgi:hypothetical protein